MIDYLLNVGGYKSKNGLSDEEKHELEHLRCELKKFKEIEEHEDKDIDISQGSDSESEKGNKSGSQSEKEDKSQGEKENKSGSQGEKENKSGTQGEKENKSGSENESKTESENEEDNVDMPTLKKKIEEKKHRAGVSAEAYGEFNKKGDFVARKIEKTEDQINRIKGSVIHSFLFNNLDPKDLEIVIGAMDEKTFKKGENVITQGDQGDCLFFVEQGNLDCFKQFSKDKEPVLVKQYQEGDAFGELALLYNAPRAATITAVSDTVITWVLDRETFNHIVKESAQKKREKYEGFLKKVEILSTIDPYELSQISDAIKEFTFKKDEYIIREGEMGDVFYILEEGECLAMKTIEPGKPDTVIKEYTAGEYFGERALIKGEPRAASIVVKTEFAKVISLDRTSFRRLLGPIEELLKRNIEKYQTYIVQGQ